MTSTRSWRSSAFPSPSPGRRAPTAMRWPRTNTAPCSSSGQRPVRATGSGAFSRRTRRAGAGLCRRLAAGGRPAHQHHCRRSPWRRCGLGELLLCPLCWSGAWNWGPGAPRSKSRVTNRAAQELYLKYGFEIVTRKAHYYADNSEDAFIMVTPPLDTPAFRQNLALRQAGLRERLRGTARRPPTLSRNDGEGGEGSAGQ
jgi:hypothetical protein